jgi:hypothetical protein
MDARWYRRIAVAAGFSLLTWVPVLVMLSGGEDGPRIATAALAIIGAILLSVFVVASGLHLYVQRRAP